MQINPNSNPNIQFGGGFFRQKPKGKPQQDVEDLKQPRQNSNETAGFFRRGVQATKDATKGAGAGFLGGAAAGTFLPIPFLGTLSGGVIGAVAGGISGPKVGNAARNRKQAKEQKQLEKQQAQQQPALKAESKSNKTEPKK